MATLTLRFLANLAEGALRLALIDLTYCPECQTPALWRHFFSLLFSLLKNKLQPAFQKMSFLNTDC